MTASGLARSKPIRAGAGNTANGSQALYWNTVGNSEHGQWHECAVQQHNRQPKQPPPAKRRSTITPPVFKTWLMAVKRSFPIQTGNFNTACGFEALYLNSSGSYNIAVGNYAGANITTGTSNIDIGNAGVTGDSGIIRIGTAGNQTATFIAGISGATVASGAGVVIDSNGQLGTVVSSERFKTVSLIASIIDIGLEPLRGNNRAELSIAVDHHARARGHGAPLIPGDKSWRSDCRPCRYELMPSRR